MSVISATKNKQARCLLLRKGASHIKGKLPFTSEMDHSLSNHLTGIGIIGVMVVLPFFLSFEHLPETDATHIALFGVNLPSMCMSQQLFGVRCPGCGMTRSFVALAHGYWKEAVSLHRLGPLVYLYFWVLLLVHAYGAFKHKRALPRALMRAHHWGGIILIVLLIINWALELHR